MRSISPKISIFIILSHRTQSNNYQSWQINRIFCADSMGYVNVIREENTRLYFSGIATCLIKTNSNALLMTWKGFWWMEISSTSECNAKYARNIKIVSHVLSYFMKKSQNLRMKFIVIFCLKIQYYTFNRCVSYIYGMYMDYTREFQMDWADKSTWIKQVTWG